MKNLRFFSYLSAFVLVLAIGAFTMGATTNSSESISLSPNNYEVGVHNVNSEATIVTLITTVGPVMEVVRVTRRVLGGDKEKSLDLGIQGQAALKMNLLP